MPRNELLAARKLIDECTRLLHEARKVAAAQQLQLPDPKELRRALAHVAAACDCLRAVDGEAEPAVRSRLGRSVGGIVQRILGPPPRSESELGDSISALRQSLPRAAARVLHGHSRTVSIPDLLSFLQVQRKTGVLRVVCPEEVIAVHFQDGDLVGAYSSCSPRGCLLGEILVEQGALRRQELENFLVFHARGQGHLGKALQVDELVTGAQLSAALICQIQRLFHRLLAAEEALFDFREGELEDLDGGMRLNVNGLLLESARVVDEGARREEQPTTDAEQPAAGRRNATPAAPAGPRPALPAAGEPGELDWLRGRLRAIDEQQTWTPRD